ncbi:Uncharacterised protein [Nocardia brasiliensis]|nr:Uncharacterised protein [Nocardia brasiliensis]
MYRPQARPAWQQFILPALYLFLSLPSCWEVITGDPRWYDWILCIAGPVGAAWLLISILSGDKKGPADD